MSALRYDTTRHHAYRGNFQIKISKEASTEFSTHDQFLKRGTIVSEVTQKTARSRNSALAAVSTFVSASAEIVYHHDHALVLSSRYLGTVAPRLYLPCLAPT